MFLNLLSFLNWDEIEKFFEIIEFIIRVVLVRFLCICCGYLNLKRNREK